MRVKKAVAAPGSPVRFVMAERVCAYCAQTHASPEHEVGLFRDDYDKLVVVCGRCDCCEERDVPLVPRQLKLRTN